jgi:hypothetical protein
MKSENNAIKILSISALILLLALVFLPGKSATAESATWNPDMLACTFQTTNGDALYVLDTRSQALVAFVYDSQAKTLVPKAVRNLNP